MRGLRRRLERLEAALRPPPEMVFVIWYVEGDDRLHEPAHLR